MGCHCLLRPVKLLLTIPEPGKGRDDGGSVVCIRSPLHFSYTMCLEFSFLGSDKSTKYHASISFPDAEFLTIASSPEILILVEFRFGGSFEWDF